MGIKRIKQINELIKRELGQILLREAEFPPEVLVTITRVETTSDLEEAKVYISVMPESRNFEIAKILKKEIYEIQQGLNKRINMRPLPRIRFVEEVKTREADRIEELLEGINE